MGNRVLSVAGINLIKGFEGLRLVAYKCLPTEQYYTIGYGHYGSDVYKGMRITEQQAEQLLIGDCSQAVKCVNAYMKKYNFNQNQFDALVSFAYNIGDIKQLTANGTRSIEEISSKIPEYCHAGGKVNAGLVSRRNQEKELFDTPCCDEIPVPPSSYVVGSNVTYSSCYNASTDPISKAIILSKWKTGVISFIKTGVANGYAISDKVGGTVRCWCNVGDFRN